MKRRKWKAVSLARGLGGVALAAAAGGGCFSLAYLITGSYYARAGIHWPDYAVQLSNWTIGSVIFLFVMLLVGTRMRPRQLAIWKEIIDALKRIAKGDFNIRLDHDRKLPGQFGEFVQTINQTAQELKKVELLRQEFISNVSHEIQSPLTSIRGFANALQNEDLSPAERKHYLSIIETESTRLSKLSDNLLKLTSLESEHQPFELRPYRLDVQLRNIVLACEPQWLPKELEMELDLAEATLVADEELMSQVWMNLIVNGIKFTPPGGSLKIGLEKTGDQAVVRISDTGIGISAADQPRIFERFYKGDKSRTRTEGGSGLGLSIVKKIVCLHQGDILVESMPGRGSTFQITVPLGQR